MEYVESLGRFFVAIIQPIPVVSAGRHLKSNTLFRRRRTRSLSLSNRINPIESNPINPINQSINPIKSNRIESERTLKRDTVGRKIRNLGSLEQSSSSLLSSSIDVSSNHASDQCQKHKHQREEHGHHNDLSVRSGDIGARLNARVDRDRLVGWRR